MPYAQFLLFGALGGLARGFVGAYKNSFIYRNEKKLNLKKLGLNILGSMVIGAVVGLVIDVNPITACASGYAGIDIIESIMKVSKK